MANLTNQSTAATTICSQNGTANCTLADDYNVLTSSVGFNAFLYICTVLVFYALSIVCLMVKYIRREKEEAVLEQYYLDFVKRETFHSLNRHKYYSELFKKIEKRSGKEQPLSAVYNETDLYARRSITPSMFREWNLARLTKNNTTGSNWYDEGISTGALTDISEETVRLNISPIMDGALAAAGQQPGSDCCLDPPPFHQENLRHSSSSPNVQHSLVSDTTPDKLLTEVSVHKLDTDTTPPPI